MKYHIGINDSLGQTATDFSLRQNWAELTSQFFCKFNSSRYFTCPSGKLRTEFTSPTSPGLSDTTFFARCTLPPPAPRPLVEDQWNSSGVTLWRIPFGVETKNMEFFSGEQGKSSFSRNSSGVNRYSSGEDPYFLNAILWDSSRVRRKV